MSESSKPLPSYPGDLYDRNRPGYPSEQLDYMFSLVPSSALANVVEFGAGSGLFTRALLAHPQFNSSIKKLIAVEPNANMRSTFTERMSNDSRVTCQDGTFETSGVEEGWAEIVFVAQAWHWCPDYGKGLTEFHRILKPGGVVFLIWNIDDLSVPWVANHVKLYERHGQCAPFRQYLWRDMFSLPSYTNFFSAHYERSIPFIFPTSHQKVIDGVLTVSHVSIQSDEEKERLKKDVADNVSKGEGKVWIDEDDGAFAYPYVNLIVGFQAK